MCQQVVEKTVKAVLVFYQILFPFPFPFPILFLFLLIHDLGSLNSLLPDALMPPGGFNLIELNPYASVKRYEEGSMQLLNDEIEAAVDATTQVIEWCQKSIQP